MSFELPTEKESKEVFEKLSDIFDGMRGYRVIGFLLAFLNTVLSDMFTNDDERMEFIKTILKSSAERQKILQKGIEINKTLQ